MRLGQDYGDWDPSIRKLKEQWTQFMSDTFQALAEEEMRLRREEVERQFGIHNRRGEQHGAMQG